MIWISQRAATKKQRRCLKMSFFLSFICRPFPLRFLSLTLSISSCDSFSYLSWALLDLLRRPHYGLQWTPVELCYLAWTCSLFAFYIVFLIYYFLSFFCLRTKDKLSTLIRHGCWRFRHTHRDLHNLFPISLISAFLISEPSFQNKLSFSWRWIEEGATAKLIRETCRRS